MTPSPYCDTIETRSTPPHAGRKVKKLRETVLYRMVSRFFIFLNGENGLMDRKNMSQEEKKALYDRQQTHEGQEALRVKREMAALFLPHYKVCESA